MEIKYVYTDLFKTEVEHFGSIEAVTKAHNWLKSILVESRSGVHQKIKIELTNYDDPMHIKVELEP